MIMRFFKQTNNGYILTVGIGTGFTEISENEYSAILTVIADKPADTDTVGYRLKADLTWEQYEKDPPDPDPDIDDSELLDILLGGAT